MTTFARTETGDLQIPRVLVTDPNQVILQTVIDGLNLWENSWFLDLTVGYPVSSFLGKKGVNVAQLIATMKQFLLSCIGIVSADVKVFFNGQTRALAYTFSATTNVGAVITGGTNQPFVVSGQAGVQ